MSAAADPFMTLAVDTSGRHIVPAFMPAFDATATFVHLCDLLARSDRSLAEVVDGLPDVHLAVEVIVTPWEQKGAVMRSLVEQSADREVDLVDGVRIHHDRDWALILPDPEEPLTRVIVEGSSADRAVQLALEYRRRIEQLVRG